MTRTRDDRGHQPRSPRTPPAQANELNRDGSRVSARKLHTDAKYKRARGLKAWNPRPPTQLWIEAVLEVLEAERDYWPVGSRHVAYQLVGRSIGGRHIIKGTSPEAHRAWVFANDKVQEVCNRGRRAGLIPWEAIADEGLTVEDPGGFDGLPSFWTWVETVAGSYERDLRANQPVEVEVWAESAGMVGRLYRATEPFGVAVRSGGGFDSLDGKYKAARRVIRAISADRRFVALHVGDLDQHGHWLFKAVEEDVLQLMYDRLAGAGGGPSADQWRADLADLAEIRRLAVTPEQVSELRLPADPETGNVQAEAVPAATMNALVTEALEGLLDLDTLTETRDRGEAEKGTIVAALAEFAWRLDGDDD